MTNTNIKPDTEMGSVGLEDDGFEMGDGDEFATGLFIDTIIWMACDEGGIPNADEPGWGQYIDGFIAGCGHALRARVWQAVDRRVALGDDQDAYHEWMIGLEDGVRAYLERTV